MIGTTVLNYRIDSLLGEGGMGTVYLATHIKLDRKAAIKVLLPEFARNQQIKERFLNEARTLSKLNHQNIVALYDFADLNDNLFLIMEYAEGTPLDTLIERVTRRLPEVRAVKIFEQILSGFAYAHSKGIVHRDIKPSNIILQTDDTPKILDFGIAKIVHGDVRLTKTGTRMGSVVYMSPEQVMGREVDQRSDIYSLGITLYEMLSGRLPYDTTTESEFDIQTKIVRETIPSIRFANPAVSANIENIIYKATAKEPYDRFQGCDEFKEALTGSLSLGAVTRTVFTQPSSRSTVVQPPPYKGSRAISKRNYTPIYLGLGLIVILGVIILFFVLKETETEGKMRPEIITTTNTGTTPTPKQIEPPKTSAAMDVVRGFIIDLGNRDFYSAFQRQNNKSWGSYDYFRSTKSFGGITRTSIESISLNYENYDEASVYVDYYSYDSANKNGRYKQDFLLKKLGGEWKIYKVKNISIDQWQD